MLELFYKLPVSFYVALCVSFLTCLLIVKTKRWHRSITSDSSEGVQKIHSQLTPRIGGLGIFVAVVCAYFSEKIDRADILGPLILAGLTAFIFGFAEDLTKQVNVLTRLLATILAGVVGWAITGISLSHVGVPLLDHLFKIQGVSVLFTAIAIGGIANAINIIDGLNGLASFALAWSCVLLAERNPSISPFAGLLVCIYPFTEVLFSVYRRKIRAHNPTGPDLLHLHSLIYRRYLSTAKLQVSENSIAGLIVGGLSIPPSIGAFYFRESTFSCLMSVMFFMFIYVAFYFRVIKFKWF